MHYAIDHINLILYTTLLGGLLICLLIIARRRTGHVTTEPGKHPTYSSTPEKPADHYRLMIEEVEEYAILFLDTNGIVQSWNRGAEKIKGYTAAEITGKHFRIFYTSEEQAAGIPEKILAEAAKNGKAVQEGWRVRKDDARFWGSVVVTAIHDHHQQLTGFTKVTRDLSETSKSEEKFRSLLNAAPDATVIVNEAGLIEMVNNQAMQLFGYSRQEMVGQQVEILIPSDLWHRHQQHRNNFAKSAGVRSMGTGIELHAVKKNGEHFPVEISLSPVQVETGLLVSAAIRDITERKQSEAAAKESELMFASYFYKSPVMKTISESSTGKIIEINEAYADFIGYSREEIIGKTSRELQLAPLFNHETIVDNITKTGFVRNLEIYITAKNGKPSWISASVDFIKLRGADCLLTTAIDITHQKKSAEKFRALLDAAPDATVMVNEEGIIQLVNRQTELLFGYTREDIIGQPVEILIPDDLRMAHRQHRNNFVKAAGVRTMGAGIELNAVKKNGLQFPVEISLSPIQTEEGMLISASVRDISARKELENDLRRSHAEMEAFTYSVSHDLRSPIRGIIGFTAILEEDYASKLDDEARRITGMIRSNTARMGHLIDDLLAFSRMGKQGIVKTRVHTQLMVKDVIAELVQQQNIQNAISWKTGLLPDMYADSSTIRQVWINLISNGVKYSSNKEKPLIEIGALADGSEVTYYVKDNGVGFDEKYKEKLFKVFQRLHDAEDFEGTGIGLALAEKIISRHGGRVWANGTEGEGACFYFLLPGPQ